MISSADKIIKLIKKTYPSASCELNFSNNFELLVAVVLSAQCTDKRVNMVAPQLFKVANNPFLMSKLSVEKIEEIIKPCGFYHSKAKNIKNLSLALVNNYNGIVPQQKEQLIKLPGVGEKTASVVVAEAFKTPAIAVDTHVHRVSNRLGLVSEKSPINTQKELEKILPKNFWIDAHHSLVLHGRYVCKSRNPNCINCVFNGVCKYYLSRCEKCI